MFKKLSLTFVFHFIAFFCKGQLMAGLDFGVTANNINKPNTITNFKSGKSIGLVLVKGWSNILSTKSTIYYMEKNYGYSHNSVVNSTKINSYLQVPIVIQFRMVKVKNFEMHLNWGVFSEYWLSSKINGTLANVYNNNTTVVNGEVIDNFSLEKYSFKYKFEPEMGSRFDCGFMSGLYLTTPISKRHFALLNLSYLQSFEVDQKNIILTQRGVNKTFNISVGWLFQFSN